MNIKGFFDGSCLSNPDGPMGFGAYIEGLSPKPISLSDGRHAKQDNTNNVAEFMGFVLLVENIINTQNCNILIHGDSQFVINVLNGKYGVGNNKRYTKIATKAVDLLKQLKKKNNVKIVWVRREYNTIADELSNDFYRINGYT